ncbi:hypothetical protein GRI72_07540 [Altererythrobacter marinus]|uniref:Uncharacterized protein n=1 Tax=Pelagerythrobacter marinus TaxID=538382 RepID=A0ABW9V151_9SPHN|nr:hypothetical protein [Pelagerythrobacter marinus]MXO68677.1 hypothetical protein [Pelagerythrobacter marinus]
MDANPFTNKWAAIALALLVVVGAGALVGDEDGGGVLDRLAQQAGQPAAGGEPLPPPASESDRPMRVLAPPRAPMPPDPGPGFDEDPLQDLAEEAEPFPDEVLIDDAEGFGSAPMIVHDREPGSEAVIEAEGEAAIVVPDAGEAGL